MNFVQLLSKKIKHVSNKKINPFKIKDLTLVLENTFLKVKPIYVLKLKT